MKRLIVFILVVFLLCGLNFTFTKGLDLKHLFAGASIEVYLRHQNNLLGFETVKNGDGEIIMSNVDNLSYILNSYDSNGFTIKVKDMDAMTAVSVLAPQRYEKRGGNIYGLKKGLYEPINVNNGFYNFQIVEGDGYVLIGVPIILGSY